MEVEMNKDYCQKLSLEVKESFSRISNALKSREVQILRQLAVYSQHYTLLESYDSFKHVSVVLDTEHDILNLISVFGRVDLGDLSYNSKFCKIEDYQKPETDHILLNKYLENTGAEYIGSKSNRNSIKFNEEIPNFVEDVSIVNSENIINTMECSMDLGGDTAEESFVILECIEKQDPNLCLHQISNISDTSQANESGHMPTQNTETDCDISVVIDSITQNLSNSSSAPNLSCKCDTSMADARDTYEDSATGMEEGIKDVSDRVRKLSMKQPVQVQQWMKQIISEPETEPVPNNVMEHSRIKVTRKESV